MLEPHFHLMLIADERIEVQTERGEDRFGDRFDLFFDVVFAIQRRLNVVGGFGASAGHDVVN